MFGNRVLQIGVHHAHDTLTLLAESEVVVEPGRRRRAGRAVGGRGAARRASCAAATRWPCGRSPAARRTCRSTRHGAALRDARRGGVHAAPAGRRRRPRPVPRCIYETFEYDPTFTDVSTPLSAVLDGAARRVPGLRPPRRRAACGRSGLAARYVSGYIETDPPPGRDAPASAPTRRTPGARCGCPSRAGSTSTRRTTTCRRTATSRWRGAATTATSPRSAASSSARPSSRRSSVEVDVAARAADARPTGA